MAAVALFFTTRRLLNSAPDFLHDLLSNFFNSSCGFRRRGIVRVYNLENFKLGSYHCRQLTPPISPPGCNLMAPTLDRVERHHEYYLPGGDLFLLVCRSQFTIHLQCH